jgi:transcriptional regulator with XRE-family HTH domain
MDKGDQVVEAFGKRVRQLRESRKPKISQEAFALEAKIDRSYYGRIERGSANLTLKQIALIAEALDVPIAKLFKEPRIKS